MKNIQISEKTLKYLIITFVCLTVCLTGLIFGYSIFKPDQGSEIAETSDEDIGEAVSVNASDTEPLDIAKKSTSSTETIDSSTKMIYEYHYTQDDVTETIAENAPYFLINMNEEKLVKVFPDWEIVSFSKEEVVMRKDVDGKSNQHYIIGVQDGFVAVFYETPVNGTNLKELTNTPIETLPKDEQQKLTKGIPVQGDDELVKVMEDYES